MGDAVDPPPRGVGASAFRKVRCKDCLREALINGSDLPADGAADRPASGMHFEYSESAAERMLDRGGSRSDRCPRHRREHSREIQSVAVAYVDLHTIGEVADRENPTGPLGGLGALPDAHVRRDVEVNLAERQFGMTDSDIRDALRILMNPETRVLVVKAGTGTGKSTFMPYRLMIPPPDLPGEEKLIKLTSLGPIIVTEPRVQATTGVARFVGEKLVANCKWKVCSNPKHRKNPDDDKEPPVRFVAAKDATPGAPEPDHPGEILEDCVITDCVDHIGPGQPVGYQVKDDKKHDDACQLVYVTDGTMVNWLRDGRLSKIGTVIVDEAHERSVNIDFIMGELKRQIDRYPHLRVIITSATFDVPFYVDFFGGSDRVKHLDVPAVKTVGYGAPLFPYPRGGDQSVPPCVCPPPDPAEPDRSMHKGSNPCDYESWLMTHWPDLELREITRKLESLRFDDYLDKEQWAPRPNPNPAEPDDLSMKDLVIRQLIKLVSGLDDMKIPGDILAFLPTTKMIEDAVAAVTQGVGKSPTDVFPLIGTMPKDQQAAALAARLPGERRKVVIATNLAETSLTVEGVRFVVDSGLITQSKWSPATATKNMSSLAHSQSGVRQRWGRVGRDAPGWVFPLYTVEQFNSLAANTPPEVTRENLEKLMMTAKAGGVDDLDHFPWPADFAHSSLDGDALTAQKTFRDERTRAEHALKLNGFLDADGHTTPFGNEVLRFTVADVPAANAIAIMVADQMACVPEVATALHLLGQKSLAGDEKQLFLRDGQWSDEVQVAGQMRRDAFELGCTDDLDLVLRVVAGWDRSDPERPPWEATLLRRRWCRQWWLNPDVLQACAEHRRSVLEALSPAMTEEVKRHVDQRLSERVRAVLSHALTSIQYVQNEDGSYTSCANPSIEPATLQNRIGRVAPGRLIALQRIEPRDQPGGDQVQTSGPRPVTLRHIVRTLPWALDAPDVFTLIERSATHASPRVLDRSGVDPLLDLMLHWPMGLTFTGRVAHAGDGRGRVAEFGTAIEPQQPKMAKIADDSDADPAGPTSTGQNNWLLGAPLPDDEEVSLRPVDTADNPSDPEQGTETNDDSSVADLVDATAPIDALERWSQSPWLVSDADRLAPVSIAPGISPSDEACSWQVVGYSQVGGGEWVPELTNVFVLASASVPGADMGQTLGRAFKNVRQVSGVLACQKVTTDGVSSLKLVCTSEDSMRTALSTLVASGSRTGKLVMSQPRQFRDLQGEEYSIAKRLRAESGVSNSNHPHGATFWELRANDGDALRRYVALACKIMPGCSLQLDPPPPETPLAVLDGVSGIETTNWKSHAFGRYTDLPWPFIQRLDTEPPTRTWFDVQRVNNDTALRELVGWCADGNAVTIDVDRSTVLTRSQLIAFLTGVARALPGGRADSVDDGHLRLLSAGPVDRPVATGMVRAFAVDAFTSQIGPTATMILLGDSARIDASGAPQREFELILFYFAGLTAALGIGLKTANGQVLLVR
jgi:HrpA-like RNA helicase